MRKHKNTYKNWLEGKVCPCPSTVKLGSDPNNYGMGWDKFPRKHLELIRREQENLYETAVKREESRFESIFNATYSRSVEKEKYASNQRNAFEEILFHLRPSQYQFTCATESDIVIDTNRLYEYRKYIKSTYEEGNPPDLSFIHSPNCPYCDHGNLPPEVEAETYYRLWKKLSSIEEETKKNDAADGIPINPAPHIFVDHRAYLFFLKLRELTLNKETIVADYAFIYQKLKGKNIKLICSNVTHRYFIEFLNKEYDAQIRRKSFPFRDPQKKQKVFKRLWTEYNQGY
jgi:hypothetical protein